MFLHLFRNKWVNLVKKALFRSEIGRGLQQGLVGLSYFLLEEKSSFAIFHIPRKEALVISTSLS